MTNTAENWHTTAPASAVILPYPATAPMDLAIEESLARAGLESISKGENHGRKR